MKQLFQQRWSLTTLLLFFTISAYAQPANDDCANATNITTLDGSCTNYSFASPTSDLANGNCVEGTINVWFTFTANGPDADITVSGINRPEITLLEFNPTPCDLASGTQLGCADNVGNYTSITLNQTGLTAGNTYYVIVTNNGDVNGTIDVCIDNPTPPANDDLCDALTPALDGTCLTGQTNAGATASWFGGCVSSGNSSVWYEATLTAGNTSLDVDLSTNTFGGNVEVLLLTNDDVCPTNNGATLIDDYCGAASGTIQFNSLTPGVTYYIGITTDPADEGTFDICLTESAPPAGCTDNEDCTSPQVLTLANFGDATPDTTFACVTDCNTGASSSNSLLTGCSDVTGPTVWYQFNMPAGAAFADITVASGDISDPQIQIWTSCNTYVTNGCDDGTGGNAAITGQSLATGTYLVSVSSVSGSNTGNFDLCVYTYPDNSPCNISPTLTANPTPDANGLYYPGEVVEFCYTINQYQKANCNWLQGIVPTFGDCWDPASFDANGMPVNVTTALTVAGNETGFWGWQPDGVVTYNNITGGSLPPGAAVGAGWFFVLTGQHPSDPNQTFGDGGAPGAPSNDCDPNGNGYTWTVCFTLTVKDDGSCTPSETCDVSFKTYADGEIGAWGDVGCVGDAETTLASTICCINLTAIPDTTICEGNTLELSGLEEAGFPGVFTWYDGDPASGGAVLPSTAVTPNTNTTYFVVYDEGGCTDTTSVNAIVLPASALNAIPDSTICDGDAIELTGLNQGGLTGTFTWYPSNPSSGLVSPLANTNVSPPSDNTYYVVYEQSGCTDTATFNVIVTTVTYTVTVIQNPTTCGGTDGIIEISGLNNSTPYDITYDDDGVTVGPNTMNSNGSGVIQLTGLDAGTYDNFIASLNGCAVADGGSYTLNDPTPPTVDNVATTDPACGVNNGTITITASGGATPYQYSTDGGTTFQAGNSFIGLGAGSYNVVVQDANNCQATTTVSLSNALAPNIDNVATTDPTCSNSNGAITITASGGTAPLQYSVDNGTTFQAGNSFSGLAAGTYDIVVEDANGCQASTQVTLTDQVGATISNVATTEPTCGNSNGSITITATGGTAPLQYSIDNGTTFQAGNSFSSLAPGTYDIVVEDANGCQTTQQVTLTDQPGPTISNVATTEPTCGNSNGTITITATGGTAPLQYSIDNGTTFQAGNSFSSLAPGTYDIVVEDANGCQATQQVTLTDQPGPTITNVATTEPTCGNSNGTIVITATGGTAPLQYSIDNGTTFQAGTGFNSLAAGTYDIVVEDANGCQATQQVTLTNQAGPTLSGFVTADPTCGNNNGSITVNSTGGTAPIQYSNDGGTTFQTGNAFTNLAAGTYDMVVEDANGCQATIQVTLQPGTSPAIDNVAISDPTCGNSNGSITITASGGTTPYQYSIDNGTTFQAGNSFTGLSAGVYDIVVEDALGCTATQQVTLSDQTGPTISNIATTDPTCGNPNGTVTVSATGGTAPLQYSTDNGTTFQAGNSFTGLAAGTYDIVVEDANGCQVAQQVTLTDQPGPVFANVATIDPTCGNPNGSITITASNGTAPLQYSIDNGVTFQAGTGFTGLAAGTYDLVIEDANGCQESTQATLVDQSGPTLSNIATTDPTCGNPNGSITITASNGTAPLQYSIDNGTTFQAGNSFIGLAAGTYDVVVEDANGCQATQQVTLTDQAGATISNIATTDPTCNGGSNGSIIITATGGASPLQYSIDNGVTFQAGNSFSGLTSGTYDVVVEDANGCQTTQQATITDPAAVGFSAAVTDETCGQSDGQIVLTGSGGDGGPYQYSIDNGVTFQASGTFGSLSAGSYNVVVQDASGCIASGVVSVSSTNAPTISVATTDASCFGVCDGSATVTISTGTSPFVITWMDDLGNPIGGNSTTISNLCAGNYSVQVDDNTVGGCPSIASFTINEPTQVTYTATITNEICGTPGDITITASGGDGGPYIYSIDNGITFQAGNSFTSLAAGNYDVVVQDATGCQGTGTETITTTGPVPVISQIDTIHPLCNGDATGQIVVTVTGGATPFQYSINGGTTMQASDTFNNLAAGSYDVTVTDANGCSTGITQVILVEPTVLTATSAITSENCGAADGSITITAGGGTAPYQYSIDNGVTFQSGTAFLNLAAGNYDVVVSDANGCTVTSLETVTSSGPSPTITQIDSVLPLCNGDTNGEITVTAAGGAGPLQYSIDGGVTYQTANIFTGLVAGTYNVVVQDSIGCMSTVIVVTLSDPAALTATLTIVDANCGNPDGSITINANGGTSPYQYSIDNGVTFQAGNSFTNLAAGTYDVVLQDANGCSVSVQAVIQSTVGATIDNITSTSPTCEGMTDGTITITASGGTAPLQYSIDNGVTFQASNVFTGVAAGTYDVVVTDANGCASTGSVTVVDGQPVVAGFNANPDNGLTPLDVDFTNTSTGATNYVWEFGDGNTSTATDPSNTYNGTGVYTAMLIASNGNCIDTAFTTITVTGESMFEMPNVFSPNGDGMNDVFGPNHENLVSFSGEIFNRWGQLIYTFAGPNDKWDGFTRPAGERAPEGTYYYVVEAEGVDGKVYKLTGHVTLTR